jgi:hypothetical protein
MLLFAVSRDLSIVNFHDFQGSFSPKIPIFKRAEYIDLKGALVVYNFIQKSAWAI